VITLSESRIYNLAVIGGGAAGFFAALNSSSSETIILEGTTKLLSKVRVSGGGRCNVTHSCFDPRELIKKYPRGSRELLGPFNRFQPKDTVEWFSERGVALKTEEDGRMFPVSDSSETIIDCFLNESKSRGIEIKLQTRVTELNKEGDLFLLKTKSEEIIRAKNVLLASGSSEGGHALAESLGHSITPLAPSLFTFKIAHPLLQGRAGISFPNAELELKCSGGEVFKDRGPLLITHWGVSGPAPLRLSAWAARELCRDDYQATLKVSWIGESVEAISEILKGERIKNPKKLVRNLPIFPVPGRFWERIAEDLPRDISCSELSNKHIHYLATTLSALELAVDGKGEFKEEFVTCGGVKLSEIDFKNFESKLVPGLFFAGEILDIDGITGGFNFQAAWTAGWHVGQAVASISDKAGLSLR